MIPTANGGQLDPDDLELFVRTGATSWHNTADRLEAALHEQGATKGQQERCTATIRYAGNAHRCLLPAGHPGDHDTAWHD